MSRAARQSMINGRSVLNSQVQNQWLVVFPYELDFTAPLDYSTVFYF